MFGKLIGYLLHTNCETFYVDPGRGLAVSRALRAAGVKPISKMDYRDDLFFEVWDEDAERAERALRDAGIPYR